MNKSGLKPLGRAVLVKPYEPEKKDSLIVLPHEVQERNQAIEQRAVVIEVGKHAWHDEPEPRAVAVMKVLVSKFAGFNAIGSADGESYRIINDRDIFAQIEVENE